jgi:hypothetical protein
MSTTQTAIVIEENTKKQRLSIPKKLLAGLDPEWVHLWEAHGSSMVRADEISLKEFRKSPAAYSFTFPTCSGKFGVCELASKCIIIIQESRAYYIQGPPVFCVEDIEIPVSQPAGNIIIRVYTPEGPGPFPVHLNFHGGIAILESRSWPLAWFSDYQS